MLGDSECLRLRSHLNSLVDLDRVLVIDVDGRLEFFDSPQALLSDRRGFFYGMAKAAQLV